MIHTGRALRGFYVLHVEWKQGIALGQALIISFYYTVLAIFSFAQFYVKALSQRTHVAKCFFSF